MPKEKQKKKKQHYIGIFKAVKCFFLSRWRLENEVAMLCFQLQLKNMEIEDLNNRLEAYKDSLAALSRGSQLEGMLHQSDIERISQLKGPEKPSS